ncbi:MAG: DUF2164 domain-containing protein [Firmicutes bacterium]|nr:DUF2164 domain-containing protein [Bacillota bacterium]
MDKRLQLTIEEQRQLIKSVQDFFLREQDQEIGDLAAMLIIDFMIKQLGPVYYNRGIQDAIKVMGDKLDDLYGLQIWS